MEGGGLSREGLTRVTLTNLLRKFKPVLRLFTPPFICRTSIVFHPRCNKRVIPCCSSIFTHTHVRAHIHIYTRATRKQRLRFFPHLLFSPLHLPPRPPSFAPQAQKKGNWANRFAISSKCVPQCVRQVIFVCLRRKEITSTCCDVSRWVKLFEKRGKRWFYFFVFIYIYI